MIVLHKNDNAIYVDESDDLQVNLYGDPIFEIINKYDKKWMLKQSLYNIGDIVIYTIGDENEEHVAIISKIKKVFTNKREYFEYYENSYNEEIKLDNIKGTVGNIDTKYLRYLKDQ